MRNKKSTYIIVSISILVGFLHFVFGPGYKGIFMYFIHSYLIDIILPLSLYLLLQIPLRRNMAVNRSRVAGAIIPFAIGTIVEILQLYEFDFLGRTYDPWDILMYGIGIGLGVVIDLTIIDKLERHRP